MNYKESLEILKTMNIEESGLIREILDTAIGLMQSEVYKEELRKNIYAIPPEVNFITEYGLARNTAIYAADFVVINNNDGTYKVLKSLELESGKIIPDEIYKELLLKAKSPMVISRDYLDKIKLEIRSK